MTSLYAWFYYIKIGCEPTYEELKLLLFSSSSFSLNGCEPTYEELKPVSNFHLFFNFCSCEPTYEELKQIPYCTCIFNSLCCEPTYEELKLLYSWLCIDSPNFVASLPMRNWNSFSCKKKRASIKLRAYLWGIETKNSCNRNNKENYVASLPMRNWNAKSWR